MFDLTPEQKERITPNKLIHPRFKVTRLPEGMYTLSIYAYEGPELRLQNFSVSSRAAHELFEELVGALSKEGRAANE